MSEKPGFKDTAGKFPDWLQDLVGETPTEAADIPPKKQKAELEKLTSKYEGFLNKLAVELRKYACSFNTSGEGRNREMVIFPYGPTQTIKAASSQYTNGNARWERVDHYRPSILVYSQKLRLNGGRMPDKAEFQDLVDCDLFLGRDNGPNEFVKILEANGLTRNNERRIKLPKEAKKKES